MAQAQWRDAGMGARGCSFVGNRWIAKMERAVSPRPRPPLVPPAITVAVQYYTRQFAMMTWADTFSNYSNKPYPREN